MTKKNAITQIFFFLKSHLEKKKINVYTKKKKKKQRIGLINLCANINRHFCHIFIKLLLPSFLPILERELFGELRETTHELHYHFPLFLSQPNTLQKVVVVVGFFFLSSSFILPKIHSTKHTLKGWSSVGFKTPSQYFRVRGHFNGIPLRNYIVWDERLYTPVQIVKCLKSFRHPALTKKTINKILLEDKTWLNDGCNLHKVN